MGFVLTAVFSSSVDSKAKQAILAAARSFWPSLALPKQDIFPSHAHFATAELDSFLFDKDEQVQVEPGACISASMSKLSLSFPTAVFAAVRVECFGDDCLYAGYVCQNGQYITGSVLKNNAHLELLKHVGMALDGACFIPFRREYFVSQGRPGEQ